MRDHTCTKREREEERTCSVNVMVYDIISKPYQSDNTVIPKYNRMAEMSTYIAH